MVVGVAHGALLAFTGRPLTRDSAWDVTSGAGNNPAPAAGDVDGDGRGDLLVVDSEAHLTTAYRNTGSALELATDWVSALDAGSGPGGIAFLTNPSG